jgi:hypothetical protein
MQGRLRVLVCGIGLIVQAAAAQAESWSIVEGRISLKKGKSSPLSGTFEASLSEPDLEDATLLGLDDFAFTAGRKDLGPPIPVEYDGLLPIAWLRIADQIHLEGEQVEFVRVRSGGKLVDESADEVTFRFLELRADADDGGYAIGTLGDTELPRRLVLKGDVYEVEQSFGLPDLSCFDGFDGTQPPPVSGSPGSGSGSSGGVIVIGHDPVVSFPTFEVDARSTEVVSARFGRRSFVWHESNGGSVVLTGRTTGSASTIEGTLYSSSNTMLTPVDMRFETVRYYSLALDGAPTLELLGIRAPAGAVVQADANGAVRVSSAGDLFVEGVLPSTPISDLTSVTLSTPGRITVTGRIELGSASLRLEAGGEIEVDPGLIPGVDYVVAPAGPAPVGLPDFCQGLRPILPAAERRVGRFSLVASAARQVKLDVQPVDEQLAPTKKRILPGSEQRLRAVVFGSRRFDVHDIDHDGRLLGRGEAESIYPGLRIFAPMNGDRYRDLVTFFLVRDAEIAYGDREICLVARTLDGELLEGCDAIEVKLPASQDSR